MAWESGSLKSNIDSIQTETDKIEDIKTTTGTIDEKVGVDTDMAGDKTLLGYQNSLYQHVHQQAKCYPTLNDGIVITGGATAWVEGNFAQIIPANTIANAFDIHYVVVESASSADIYELSLYSGAIGEEVEIGRIRIDKESANQSAANCPIQIPAQLANTRISAKVASKNGGNHTLTISVYYHIYS